jgi:transcriptional regulator with GAF, ATPase, and Fis domain
VLGVMTVKSFSRPTPDEDAALCLPWRRRLIALENAQLSGQMRRRTAELALLNTVSTAVGSTLDLEQVLQIVATSIMPVMGCQKSALFLLDSPGGKLRLSAWRGLGTEFQESLIWQDDNYLQRIRNQGTIIVTDITTSGRPVAEIELALKEGYSALAEVTLEAQNELIGVLCVFSTARYITDRDLLTTFAVSCDSDRERPAVQPHRQALARRVSFPPSSVGESESRHWAPRVDILEQA